VPSRAARAVRRFKGSGTCGFRGKLRRRWGWGRFMARLIKCNGFSISRCFHGQPSRPRQVMGADQSSPEEAPATRGSCLCDSAYAPNLSAHIGGHPLAGRTHRSLPGAARPTDAARVHDTKDFRTVPLGALGGPDNPSEHYVYTGASQHGNKCHGWCARGPTRKRTQVCPRPDAEG